MRMSYCGPPVWPLYSKLRLPLLGLLLLSAGCGHAPKRVDAGRVDALMRQLPEAPGEADLRRR